MTGWAWLFLAIAWGFAVAWVVSVWMLRPRGFVCACGTYRMNGWLKVKDDQGLHERDRCQPHGEAL